MARMPRVVVPGYPHHVTQRGNRRMKTFFCPEDYQTYLDLVCEFKVDAGEKGATWPKTTN
jgi:putative transposase